MRWYLLFLFMLASGPVHCTQIMEQLRPGILEIRSEDGRWGGINSRGLICLTENEPGKQIVRKEFDLSTLPPGTLEQAQEIRLLFVMRMTDSSRGDGLNSRFAVDCNGHRQEFSTNDPQFTGWKKPGRDQFACLKLKKDWLIPGGKQVITIMKTAGDDWLYPWVDPTVPANFTSVSLDGGRTFARSWHGSHANTGEMMMRLQFSNLSGQCRAVWRDDGTLDDPEHLLGYVAREDGKLRLEMDSGFYQTDFPLTVSAEYGQTPGQAAFFDIWHDPMTVEAVAAAENLTVTFPANSKPFAMEFQPPFPKKLTVTFAPVEKYPDDIPVLAPKMAPPHGRRQTIRPACQLTGNTATLSNQALTAVFQIHPRLTLNSLWLAEADRQVLSAPQETKLFLCDCNGRETSLPDAEITSVTPLPGPPGFQAAFRCAETGLSGIFKAVCLDDELEMRLEFSNISTVPCALRTAFPHLSGLAISERAEDDYYLIPWGGGLVSNHNISWRTAYGSDMGGIQMLDIYSVSRGGGMYLHVADQSARLKILNLRKGRKISHGYTHPIYDWPGVFDTSRFLSASLGETELLAMAVDYQQQNLPPGGHYAYPPVRLGTHEGSWKTAVKRYAEWSKTVWPPRPYPSRLTGKWNLRGGFGLAKPLLNNEEYDKSYIGLYAHEPHKGAGEVLELIGWHTIGRTAPLGVPFEQEDILGPKYWRIPRWIDPATGTLGYSNHLGDYTEYNPQWGGLPVLRRHLDKIRQARQIPIFYLTPIGISLKTRAEQRWIPRQAVINPAFRNPRPTPVDPKEPPGICLNYMKYCACIDNAEYIRYIAQTTAQVCRDTGIEGIRLDEMGGSGYICLNPRHQHLFSETPGNNGWMQATAELCRQVHAEMDKLRPGLLLLTEFPGCDHVSAFLEGALTYDTQTKICPPRPAPINLQRAFFPECRLFEIDTTPKAAKYKWFFWFWNGMGTYNSCYPEEIRLILNANSDALAFGEMEPLEEGYEPGILVNRFTGDGGRQVRNILNLHQVSRLVTLPAREGWRYVEIISGRELKVLTGKVTLPVRPRSLASVAEIKH